MYPREKLLLPFGYSSLWVFEVFGGLGWFAVRDFDSQHALDRFCSDYALRNFEIESPLLRGSWSFRILQCSQHHEVSTNLLTRGRVSPTPLENVLSKFNQLDDLS